MNVALITGASNGLGREFFNQLKNNEDIDTFYLLGRDEKRLKELTTLSNKKVVTFSLDLCDEKKLDDFLMRIDSEDIVIKYLVNSAGFGIIGEFYDSDLTEQLDMIKLNCIALTKITHVCLKKMKENSYIFNIASVAAFLPQTYFSVYAATKSFVLSFSEAIAAELEQKNIYVLAVCPNPMDTNFFKRAGDKKGGKFKKIGFESPKRVVEVAIDRIHNKKIKSITHPSAKILFFFSHLLPHKFVTHFERKYF